LNILINDIIEKYEISCYFFLIDFPFKFTFYKKIPEKQNVKTQYSPSLRSCTDGGETLSNLNVTNVGNTTSIPGKLVPPYFNGAMSNECGFPPKYCPHVVSEYFNIEEFAVISSAGLESVEKESKLKLLMSSACIALSNTNW